MLLKGSFMSLRTLSDSVQFLFFSVQSVVLTRYPEPVERLTLYDIQPYNIQPKKHQLSLMLF